MTNQNTAALLGEDGDIEKLRELSDAAPAGPWTAAGDDIVAHPSGEWPNIAFAPGVAAFVAGAVNYVRAALARTNNTGPVRALIEKWRRQAVEHGTRTFTGNDHALFANELEAAIASAPPGAPSDDLSPLLDSLMRAAFDDGDRGREKFSDATMAAREAVLAHVRGASAPPSAPVGVEGLVAKLRAVLCDPAGNVCIEGSDADRAEVQGALDALEALAKQPAAPSGEAVGLPNDLRWKLDNLRPGSSGVVTLNREEWDCVRAMFTAPQQPAAVDWDEVRRVAQHIGIAVDHIEKMYPGAKMLDSRSFLRNMRRWHERLTTALAAQQQGGRADG